MSKPLYIPKHLKQLIANLKNTDDRYDVFSQALWQYRWLQGGLSSIPSTLWSPGCTNDAVPGTLFHRSVGATHKSFYIAGGKGRWMAIILKDVCRVTWSGTVSVFPYISTVDQLIHHINVFLDETMEIPWVELTETDKELHTVFTDLHYGVDTIGYLKKLTNWAAAKRAGDSGMPVKDPVRRFVRGYRNGDQNVFEIYKNDVIISLVDKPTESPGSGTRWDVYYGPNTSDAVILSCRPEQSRDGGVVAGAFKGAAEMQHELAFETWYHLSKPLIGVPYELSAN